MKHGIPGLTAPPATVLPVLLSAPPAPRHGPETLRFSRWLAGIPPWALLLLGAGLLLCSLHVVAQGTRFTAGDAFEALGRWIPFLLIDGFTFTVLISVLTMALGTVAGVLLGWVRSRPTGSSPARPTGPPRCSGTPRGSCCSSLSC